MGGRGIIALKIFIAGLTYTGFKEKSLKTIDLTHVCCEGSYIF
jgi:hypothetical protein